MFGVFQKKAVSGDDVSEETRRVMHDGATEPPFKNAWWDEKRPGIYVDPISRVPLFSSREKFDSGSGWPSFTRPLAAPTVREKPDTSHGMRRTEVRGAASDGHLGHVFDDGPGESGQRYCINSAALDFIPREEMADRGYAHYRPLLEESRPPMAIFAAGCFWGVEAAFEEVDGVQEVISGYTGGHVPDPGYKQVCTGRTGHAEAVRVTYDPQQVSYGALLEKFLAIHDPTQENRQGPDVGTQYRSAVFCVGEDQCRMARTAVEKREGAATEVTPAGPFWPAEDVHQDYLKKRQGG